MFTSIHTKSTCSAAESYTFRALNEFENGVSERIELTDDYLQIYEHNIVYRIDCRHAQQVLLIQAFSCKDLRKDEEHKVIIICEEQISKGKHSAEQLTPYHIWNMFYATFYLPLALLRHGKQADYISDIAQSG